MKIRSTKVGGEKHFIQYNVLGMFTLGLNFTIFVKTLIFINCEVMKTKYSYEMFSLIFIKKIKENQIIHGQFSQCIIDKS
jgi:hypothetical protein